MDITDKATEREEAFREDALRAVRSKVEPAGVSAERCMGCDEPIPEIRRVAIPGVFMCVECQADLERRMAK